MIKKVLNVIISLILKCACGDFQNILDFREEINKEFFGYIFNIKNMFIILKSLYFIKIKF